MQLNTGASEADVCRQSTASASGTPSWTAFQLHPDSALDAYQTLMTRLPKRSLKECVWCPLVDSFLTAP